MYFCPFSRFYNNHVGSNKTNCVVRCKSATYQNREGEMWRINGHSAILWKGHRVFEVFARFSATSYLSDVFILEMAKARVHIFHHSETVSSSHTRKVILPPVLFAMSTKGCALVTEVAPLGSTPNRFDGIHLDTGVEIVSRIIVAWVLRKVELVHLSICIF